MLTLYRRGLLVILLVRLRQTPWDKNTLKVPRFFVCVFFKELLKRRNNGVTRKAAK